VPLSYLVSDGNSGLPQPAQTKVPLRFSVYSGLVKGRSVPAWRGGLGGGEAGGGGEGVGAGGVTP
jgi:hypothetical protein